MTPQFSETWGSAYLQIVIIILVFVIGIPTLLFQISITNDIRRIIRKQIKLIWWFILMIFLIGASLLYIWFLHPCPGIIASPIKSLIANSLLSFIIIISFCILCVRLLRNSRDQIIKRIENVIIKQYKKSGDNIEKILKESINDIIYLGENGNGGDEKQIVLESISQIFHNTVFKVRNGNFFILLDLVYGIQKVITNKEKEGNDENFLFANRCLCEIILHFNSELSLVVEKNITITVLCNLGQFSLNNKSETVTLMFLQEFDDHASALFNFGKTALINHQYFFAIAGLSKLETLYQDKSKSTLEVQDFLLGLIGHFWFSGLSCRLHVGRFIMNNFELFQPTFVSTIDHSIKYHENSVDYLTVDQLYKFKWVFSNITTKDQLHEFLDSTKRNVKHSEFDNFA